jgi:SNF2 family DNA or RNA helicase
MAAEEMMSATLTPTLMPHQVRAVDWLLNQPLVRGIFADQPGLGKTFPAIVAAAELQGPRLVVVPAYLQENWHRAIEDLCPGVCVARTGGKLPDRKQQIEWGSRRADFLLTTYEHLRIHAHELQGVHWSLAIFDEAHKLRGRNTAQAQAAAHLYYDALWLLTGEPQVRDISDYYQLLHMIDPAQFSSYWRFIGRWALIDRTPWGDKVVGCADPDGLRALIGPHILRRTFQSEGVPIPDAVHKKVEILLSEQFLKEYRKTKREYRTVGPSGAVRYLDGPAAVMTALARLVARRPEKLSALKEIISDHSDEQVIIWTWYRDTGIMLAEELAGLGRRPIRVISGAQPASERHTLIEAFKATPNGILIPTIKSLGEGENLQSGSTAVFYEHSYLAADNEQAVARQRRIGQENPVRVYDIIARKTINETVYDVQEMRGTVMATPTSVLEHEYNTP